MNILFTFLITSTITYIISTDDSDGSDESKNPSFELDFNTPNEKYPIIFYSNVLHGNVVKEDPQIEKGLNVSYLIIAIFDQMALKGFKIPHDSIDASTNVLRLYFHNLETGSEIDSKIDDKKLLEILKSINKLVPANIKRVGLYSEYEDPFTLSINKLLEGKTGSIILIGNTIEIPDLELRIPNDTELFESNFEAFLEIDGLCLNEGDSTIYLEDNYTFSLNENDIPFNELKGLDNLDRLNIVNSFLEKFENRGN